MSRTNDVSDRYIGLGNLNQYSFDFKVSGDASDLLIIKTDADNNVIFKVRGDDTEYVDSVTFNDGNVGGTVTLIDNLETDYILTIRLLPENPEQDDQYRNQSDFSLKKLENSFDQQNGYIQAMWDILKRVPRIPDQFLDSAMDQSVLGEIDDALDLATDETVYLAITKTADGLKFVTSAGTSEGLTAVETDVADLQLYKEDRTMGFHTANNTTLVLTSSSPRKTVLVEAAGATANVSLPSESSAGGLNVGRKFTIYNQTDATQSVYCSDGATVIDTIDSWASKTFEFQYFTEDNTDTGAWWGYLDYVDGDIPSMLADINAAKETTGTWTPVVEVATGALATPQKVKGFYRKQAGLVYVSGTLIYPANAASGATIVTFYISGLPFVIDPKVSVGDDRPKGIINIFSDSGFITGTPILVGEGGDTMLVADMNGSVANAITEAVFSVGNTTTFEFSMVYETEE